MELSKTPISCVETNPELHEADLTESQAQNEQESEPAKEDRIIKAMVIAVVKSPSGEENLRLFPATNVHTMTRSEVIKAMAVLRDTLISQEAVDVFVREAVLKVFSSPVTFASSTPAT